MKTIVLALLIVSSALSAPAVIALPPNIGTNDIALYSLGMRVNVMQQHNGFMEGKVNRLETELNRVETGFLLLIILNVSTVAAICLLIARDKIKGRWSPDSAAQAGGGSSDRIQTKNGTVLVTGTSPGAGS